MRCIFGHVAPTEEIRQARIQVVTGPDSGKMWMAPVCETCIKSIEPHEDLRDRMNSLLSDFIKSGPHLAVVRSWIQNHASNGEAVKWSSTDMLRLHSVCVLDFEILAQKIADAVRQEIMKEIKIAEERIGGI